VLRGDRVVLTELRDEDSDALFRWINDRELVLLSAPFAPVSEDAHREWFDSIRSRPDVEIYAIRTVDGERLIGTCQLHSIDRERGEAQLQIRIGERDAWGAGRGSEAVRLLLARAFEGLGLLRVELHVFATNERALRAYERAGFVRDEVRPGAVRLDDEAVDVVVMSVTPQGAARASAPS
jgi:RimJ/RimL family protein N-acetyltransferase